MSETLAGKKWVAGGDWMAGGWESSGGFFLHMLVPGLGWFEGWTQRGHCELVFLPVSFPCGLGSQQYDILYTLKCCLVLSKIELPSDESSFHKFHVPKSLRPLFKKLLLLFHSSSRDAPHVTWPIEDYKQPIRQSRVTARVRWMDRAVTVRLVLGYRFSFNPLEEVCKSSLQLRKSNSGDHCV